MQVLYFIAFYNFFTELLSMEIKFILHRFVIALFGLHIAELKTDTARLVDY